MQQQLEEKSQQITLLSNQLSEQTSLVKSGEKELEVKVEQIETLENELIQQKALVIEQAENNKIGLWLKAGYILFPLLGLLAFGYYVQSF